MHLNYRRGRGGGLKIGNKYEDKMKEEIFLER
jgi:hypothetical protein